MDFIPAPPVDRDFAKARDAGRREHAAASMRKPTIGAGLLAAVNRLTRRS